MIEQIAQRLVSWQVDHHLIAEKDRSLYCYGYGLLIGQAVNLLISFLIAVLFGTYVAVAVYLAAYIPLRSYAGGHHAGSYGRCTIISTGILASVCALSRLHFIEGLYIHVMAVLAMGYMILRFAPVEAGKKPLEKEERVRYRKRSIGVWITETAVWAGLYGAGFKAAASAVILAYITLTCMLVMGLIENRRRI